MKKNSTNYYSPDPGPFIFSATEGTDNEFSGIIIIPPLLPSGQTIMCVTDYNIVIVYLILSHADHLQKYFASTDYRIINHKTVRASRAITYTMKYDSLGSESKITIAFFDESRILVAEFIGTVKVK
ncbi:MAG: hypothetical protein V4665_00145 [Patescibacteria group bacterium]